MKITHALVVKLVDTNDNAIVKIDTVSGNTCTR